jgi:hypothetical protein
MRSRDRKEGGGREEKLPRRPKVPADSAGNATYRKDAGHDAD